MGLVRRLAAAISRLHETHFPTLFHAASALSAPSGHLPLEGKAKKERHFAPIYIRGEVATFLISHASEVFIRSQGTARPRG